MASPNATYELVVKTAMGKGTAIPKGRYLLPREAKKVEGDKILVFAEGRAAHEARQAGADIVGGLELVDGVRTCGLSFALVLTYTPDYIRQAPSQLVLVYPRAYSAHYTQAWSCPWPKRIDAFGTSRHCHGRCRWFHPQIEGHC